MKNLINKDNPFELVKIKSTNKIGIIESRGFNFYNVWIEYDLKTTEISINDIELITIPDVPKIAYNEEYSITGGIGKNTRWKLVFPNPKCKEKVVLNIMNIEDKSKFISITNEIRPFGLWNQEFTSSNSAKILIPDPKDIGTIAAKFHVNNIHAVPTEEIFHSGGKLALERLDRSRHLWYAQKSSSAGPLRDLNRWNFSFLPKQWKILPFTWYELCENIKIDPLNDYKILPVPLRNIYIEFCINNNPELKNDLVKILGDVKITSQLNKIQNKQLLTAAYWSSIAPFDKDITFKSNLLRFRFLLFGFSAREIGAYKRNSRYIGFGEKIRNFKKKPSDKLPVKILNSICQKDGSLKGRSIQKTRKTRTHISQNKRTVIHDEMMRKTQDLF